MTMRQLHLTCNAARITAIWVLLVVCIRVGATGQRSDRLTTQQHSQKAPRASGAPTKAPRLPEVQSKRQDANRQSDEQPTSSPSDSRTASEKGPPYPPARDVHNDGPEWKWLIAVVALAVAIIGTILGRRWHYSKRCDEARQKYEELFTRLVDGHLSVESGKLTDRFFCGADIAANAIDYIRLDLDAPRQRLLDQAVLGLSREGRGLCVISAVGGRQQGKSIFLARLAHNLATDRSREVWLAKLTHAPEILKHPEVIRRYFDNHHLGLLGGVSKCKRRLTLLVDDVVNPDQVTDLSSDQRAGIDFIHDLASLPVTAIISSVSEMVPESMSSVHSIRGFELQEEDLRPIVDKWRSNGKLDQEKASKLIQDAKLKSLYGKQLFAFLAVAFEKSAWRDEQSHHLDKFRADYDALKPSAQLAIMSIASSQLLGVPVPRRLIQKLDSQFSLDHSFVIVREYGNDADDKVYECGGIFLPRWLLIDKFRKTRFDHLRGAYGLLFDTACKLSDFGKFQSEKDFIVQLLLRLAIGPIPGIFEGTSAYEAASLLDGCGEFVQKCVQDTEDISGVLDWARIHTRLNRWDDATPLFQRALELHRKRLSADPLNSFRLVSAIVSSPDMELVRSGASLLPDLIKFVTDEADLRPTFAPKILHVYTDYMLRLEGPAAAIEVLRKHLAPEGNIKPDGVLYMRLGQLCEGGGGDWNEAEKNYRRAAEWDQSPETALNCKHRYAVFLSRHKLRDVPEPSDLFKKALR